MQKIFQKIIYVLKKSRGNPVPLSLITPNGLSETDSSKDKAKRPPKKKKHSARPQNPAMEILKNLENYDLIQIKGNKIIPKYPFLIEARLSVAPNGMAFGMGSFEKDILIPHGRRGGANHRDRVLIELLDTSRDRFEGKVVSIVEAFTTQFLARVEEPLEKNSYLIRLIDLPDSPLGVLNYSDKLEKGTYTIAEETGESREVMISRNHSANAQKQRRSYFNECQVFQLMAVVPEEDPSSDHMRVAARFKIPVAFDPFVLPLKKEMKKLEKNGLKDKNRVNLKNLYACTIDGADSKDFDDAISYEKKGNAHVLYVHIADVGQYVQKDSPLDLEAAKRGNSYYLKNSVFPMLPTILSEDFCSLRPKTKRLSFTCEMHYDDNAELISYKIYKSVIYLSKRFTYEEAEKHLNDQRLVLKDIWALVEKLHQKRIKAGKIELNIKETDITMDAHGRIIAMNDKTKLHSHRLIEECMLSANICTAHFMRKNKIPGIYRVHDPMPESGLDKINAFLKLYGFKAQIKSLHYSQIQKVIQLVEKSEVEEIFNYILLRSFSAAVYKNLPLGHWGLGFPDYTHFTSPIRRFSDLVVHRQLYAYLKKEPLPYQKKQLEAIGAETSRLERVAMEAEKTMLRLISLRFFKKHIGQTYTAFISGFNQNGLFIQVQAPRVDGFVPAATFDRKGEVYVVDEFTVKLPKFSKAVNLGQKVKVKLTRTDWEKIQLSFEIMAII